MKYSGSTTGHKFRPTQAQDAEHAAYIFARRLARKWYGSNGAIIGPCQDFHRPNVYDAIVYHYRKGCQDCIDVRITVRAEDAT